MRVALFGGRALIRLAEGYPRPILNTEDINRLALGL
jgi:hypothetical protein